MSHDVRFLFKDTFFSNVREGHRKKLMDGPVAQWGGGGAQYKRSYRPLGLGLSLLVYEKCRIHMNGSIFQNFPKFELNLAQN